MATRIASTLALAMLASGCASAPGTESLVPADIEQFCQRVEDLEGQVLACDPAMAALDVSKLVKMTRASCETGLSAYAASDIPIVFDTGAMAAAFDDWSKRSCRELQALDPSRATSDIPNSPFDVLAQGSVARVPEGGPCDTRLARTVFAPCAHGMACVSPDSNATCGTCTKVVPCDPDTPFTCDPFGTPPTVCRQGTCVEVPSTVGPCTAGAGGDCMKGLGEVGDACSVTCTFGHEGSVCTFVWTNGGGTEPASAPYCLSMRFCVNGTCAFAPKTGEACRHDTGCLFNTDYCDVPTGVEGVCKPLLPASADGGACQSDRPDGSPACTSSDLLCCGVTKTETCMRLGHAEGDACCNDWVGLGCTGDLYCDDTGHCKQRGAVGASCEGPFQCGSLNCVEGMTGSTCGAPLPACG
jgi:hypothetical protein